MTLADPWPSRARAWQAAWLLTAANAVAFADRTILTLLMEPVQRALGVSDTAMGILHGFSFAVFYSLFALPIASLADRTSRRTIVAAGMFFFSLMTALCAFAQSYTQLLLARVGVGAGEGTLSPGAYSLLSDYFPPADLPRAIGVFSTGIYLGNSASLVMAGGLYQLAESGYFADIPLLRSFASWQLPFLAAGIAGLALAALLYTIHEPQRRHLSGSRAPTAPSDASQRALVEHFTRHLRAYVGVFIGFSSLIVVGYGNSAWIPTFLVRRFGASIAELGFIYGAITLVCGGLGAIAGGWFASRLAHRGRPDASLLAALLGMIPILPAWLLALFAPTLNTALVGIALVIFSAALPFGGGYAAVQEITPNHMRARVSALFLLCINLIGVGLGPVLVGLCTDHLFSDRASLHLSMALVVVIFIPIAATAMGLALAPYRLAKASPWTTGQTQAQPAATPALTRTHS